jgi:hypothetical protein
MTSPTYDTDFYAWTLAQAAAIRAKDWPALDLEHLAEEIESLGNEQRHAVRSHLRVILLHLLKWVHQPTHRGPSWRRSVLRARVEVADRLEHQPSLQRLAPELLAQAYPRARRLAAAETGLSLATFPAACPWALAQVLDDDFWPEGTP